MFFKRDQTDLPVGNWLVEKYGWYFMTGGKTLNAFQRTKETCFPLKALSGKLRHASLKTAWGPFNFSVENDALAVEAAALFEPAFGNKVEPLTDCTEVKKADAFANFDIFWHTFADFYPFFDLYKVDWQAQYDSFRSRMDAKSSPKALAAVLEEMVEPLQDAHVTIESKNGAFSPYSGRPAWVAQAQTAVSTIKNSYVTDLVELGERRIRYGHLTPNVGYILIAAFGLTESAVGDMEKLLNALDDALEKLQSCSHLVIDMRLNQGGYDAIAVEMAGRFADQKRPFLSRKNHHPFGEETAVCEYIQPTGKSQWVRPITIISSGVTISAGEVFTQAMRQLPHVHHIGETTAGFFSDALPRFLPNGTFFTLAHQQLFSPDGELLEGRGCIPQTIIPMKSEDIAKNYDATLTWVKNNSDSTL